MTNPLKGETTVSTVDKTYRLVFDVNALCMMEAALGGTAAIIVVERLAKERRFTDLRILLWAGLQEFHDDLDVRDAGRLISEIGMEDLTSKILGAISAAFPTPKTKGKGKGGDKGAVDPKQAADQTAAGTGSNSTEPGANSATAQPATSGD